MLTQTLTLGVTRASGEGQLCQFAFVSSVLSVMSVQLFCGEDEGFCGEDEGFCGKDKGFLAKMKDFLNFSSTLPKILHLCQCLPCIIMREGPTLGMCRHTNEGKSIDLHD